MPNKKMAITVVSVAAAAGVAAGGASLAYAAGTPSATPSSTATSSATPSGQASSGARQGRTQDTQHTAITGDELAKVTAAVKAKDANITVSQAWKDDDGYDVDGTSNGTQVHYEVSADLATVTLQQAPQGGRGQKQGNSTAAPSSAPSGSATSQPTTSPSTTATSAPASPSATASPSK